MRKIFTVLGIMCASVAMNAQIVINEVYGGGGNSGAPFQNDFIELINRGTTSITLTGATLQYASAAGTFNSYHTLPSITLSPGQKYLVQEASGAGAGVALPTPDFTATTLINFDGTTNTSTTGFAIAAAAGKVVLASNATQVTSPTSSNVLDFVGFGTANQYEGSAAAPAPSNTTSISRTNGVDTNNNAADFTTGTPTPQNSSSGSLAVADFGKEKSLFVKNTFVKNNEIVFGAEAKNVKVYNMFGQVVKTASVKTDGTLNVADLAKGNYIVTGTVNNEAVSQKILKD